MASVNRALSAAALRGRLSAGGGGRYIWAMVSEAQTLRLRDPDALIAAVQAVAQHQDRAAFARLFAHFAPRVKAYLVRLGADAASAEDLMQEIMLTVWRRADSYDPAQAAVSTWIFTIARNRRIDALRRARGPQGVVNDPALQPDPPAGADQAIEAGEWQERLRGAIGDLPPEQSEMLRLAYFDDQSHSDIAARLKLPLGTVKSRLRLAIGRLRAKLGDHT
jgi:RNA polymerase sigma-70 factor (ECF subfamily)